MFVVEYRSVHDREFADDVPPFAEFGIPKGELFGGWIVEVVSEADPADIRLFCRGERANDPPEELGFIFHLEQVAGSKDPGQGSQFGYGSVEPDLFGRGHVGGLCQGICR